MILQCLGFVDYNFSHRIIHFSFGERAAGVVNPLEGEEKLTSDRKSDFHLVIHGDIITVLWTVVNDLDRLFKNTRLTKNAQAVIFLAYVSVNNGSQLNGDEL